MFIVTLTEYQNVVQGEHASGTYNWVFANRDEADKFLAGLQDTFGLEDGENEELSAYITESLDPEERIKI